MLELRPTCENCGIRIGDVPSQGWNLFHSGFFFPVMVLKESALEHNLRSMARFCAELGVAIAPHGKTTMAPQIFARQLAAGAFGITAATAEHARVYRSFGVPRILLANELVRADEARPFVVTDYAGAGGRFEALAVSAPAEPDRHRWYAFPEMTADETIVFRTYDTDIVRAGGTFFTPHTAFRDPEVVVGEPARSSIELRATCLFT